MDQKTPSLSIFYDHKKTGIFLRNVQNLSVKPYAAPGSEEERYNHERQMLIAILQVINAHHAVQARKNPKPDEVVRSNKEVFDALSKTLQNYFDIVESLNAIKRKLLNRGG